MSYVQSPTFSKQAVKDLQRDLEFYDGLTNPEELYMRGRTLVQLWKAAQEDEHKGKLTVNPDDVIDTFTRAIELRPKEPLYLIDRSNFYMDLGKKELAVVDYTQAQKFATAEPQRDYSALWSRRIRNDLDTLGRRLGLESEAQSSHVTKRF